MSRLLDEVRVKIRSKHYSHRIEQACIRWIKSCIFFTRKGIRPGQSGGPGCAPVSTSPHAHRTLAEEPPETRLAQSIPKHTRLTLIPN